MNRDFQCRLVFDSVCANRPQLATATMHTLSLLFFLLFVAPVFNPAVKDYTLLFLESSLSDTCVSHIHFEMKWGGIETHRKHKVNLSEWIEC